MGKTQVTINRSFYKKMDDIQNRAKEGIWLKGEEVVSYAAAISPVQTGAYVESFSVVGRGEGGGRSRSSDNRPILPAGAKDAKKQDEAARLRAEVRAVDPLEEEGFTLRNRAPHNTVVEDKHNVFLRTKDRIR
jgi:hypothetical protein